MNVSVEAEEVGLYVAVEEVWSIRTTVVRTKQRRVAVVVVFNMFDLTVTQEEKCLGRVK